jgi:hypothetical protein
MYSPGVITVLSFAGAISKLKLQEHRLQNTFLNNGLFSQIENKNTVHILVSKRGGNRSTRLAIE